MSTVALVIPPMSAVAIGPKKLLRNSGISASTAAAAVSVIGRKRRTVASTIACSARANCTADDKPREEEVERARAYAGGRQVLAFENSGAVARYAAHQAIIHDDEIDPDVFGEELNEAPYERVDRIAVVALSVRQRRSNHSAN